MPFVYSGGLKFWSFDSFPDREVLARVYTRRGGVSPAPWESLNLGGNIGDGRENILENRRRIFADCDRPIESLFDVWQVHGTAVALARSPRPLEQQQVKADVIISNEPGVTLMMRFADCVPILIYDPVRHAMALVHAGWKGTVRKVVSVALSAMAAAFGSRPGDLLAALGPAIGPDHYEVAPDVETQVAAAFGADSASLLTPIPNGKALLDLWSANELLLRNAGVRQVEVAGLCTACDTQDWYSHRAERGRTGRFAALLALREP